MSIEKDIIVKPKLSFFQNLRKKFLIKTISYSKYTKAPEYLKNDDDVILAVVQKNPYNIVNFSIQQQLKLLKVNINFFDAMQEKQKWEIIRKEPTYISNLNEKEVLNFISANSPEYIQYLSEDFQYELLIKDNEYFIFYDRFNYDTKRVKPTDFIYKLEYFSPEIVEKATIHYVQLAKKEKGDHWDDKRNNIPFLRDMKIDKLPINLQIKITLLDEEFIKLLSKEAAIKYVGNNPILVNFLSTERKIDIIKEHPEFFNALDRKTQRTITEKSIEIRSLISDDNLINLGYEPNNTTLNADSFKKTITNSSRRNPNFSRTFTDYLKGEHNIIIELAKFEPSVLSTWGIINVSEAHKKIMHTVDLCKSLTENEDIHKALDLFPRRFSAMASIENNIVSENIPKVLLNEKILERTNPYLIIDFINNPDDTQILENIIASTYGEQTRDVFKERPNITLYQIPCLEIFDPIVIEKFGTGTLNNMITYNTTSSLVLGDLVRNPDKMKKFEEFNNLFGEEKDDALGFNDKLLLFNKFSTLFTNIDIENLTDKQKESLFLKCNDSVMTSEKNETEIIKVETLEDLDLYDKKRNELYDDYIKKVSSPEKIKDAISRRFFAIKYEPSIDNTFKTTNLSLNSLVHYYNLETFVSDERTINSGNFSENELDTLELINIIDKINNPDILKSIYSRLSEREDIIKPLDFAKTKSKIPTQYSKELVNTLLTFENAKDRALNNENGIEYNQTEDGFEVISLSGADFRIMLHTPGLNNSNLDIPWNSDPAEVWKHFENGCSTISACVIEPEMLKSCASEGNVNFGFSNVPVKQIIGMSHRDAHVSHRKGEIDPYFQYDAISFNYPDELVRKTAAQITGQETKDLTHEYNEVTMYRNYVDSKNSKYGGKVMPDYIVVYGKTNDNHKKIAKQFSKNGKPIPIIEIDTKAYGDRTYARGARKEDHSNIRESGEIISEIKEIIEDER